MLQRGSVMDFAFEPLDPYGAGQLGWEALQCDIAPVPEIAGEKDDGHAATPEFALEGIAVAKCFGETGVGCAHAAPMLEVLKSATMDGMWLASTSRRSSVSLRLKLCN